MMKHKKATTHILKELKKDRPRRLTTGIVCKNHGKFLKTAVQSVLDQNLVPTEIILIDDHSTDNTHDVMMDLYKTVKDTQIVILPHRSKGHIDAYNYMIETSPSPFFHLMAADDVLIYKFFYENCLRIMESKDIGFVFGGLEWIDDKGDPLGVTVSPPFTGTHRSKEWLLALKRYGNFICGGAVVIRTDLQKRSLYDPDLPFSADFKNWVKALQHCKKAASIHTSVYGYRRHDGQMTSSSNAPQKERDLCKMVLDEAL